MIFLNEYYITKYQLDPNNDIYKNVWDKNAQGSSPPTDNVPNKPDFGDTLSLFINNAQVNINNCYRLKDWQKRAIDKINSGKDLFILGSPGAGKTTPYICLWLQYYLNINVIENRLTKEQAISFLFNLINLFYIERLSNLKKLLILVPTRTLAKQTYDEFIVRFSNIMCQAMNISMATLYSSEIKQEIQRNVNKFQNYFNNIKTEILNYINNAENNIIKINSLSNTIYNSNVDKTLINKELDIIKKINEELKNDKYKLDFFKKKITETVVISYDDFTEYNTICIRSYMLSLYIHICLKLVESLYIIIDSIIRISQTQDQLIKITVDKYIDEIKLEIKEIINIKKTFDITFSLSDKTEKANDLINKVSQHINNIENKYIKILNIFAINRDQSPISINFNTPITVLNFPDIPEKQEVVQFEFWSTGKGSFLDLFLKLFDEKTNPGVKSCINIGVINNSLERLKNIHRKYVIKHNRPVPANYIIRWCKDDIQKIISNQNLEHALKTYIRHLVCLRTGTMKENSPENSLVTISIYQGSDKITSSGNYKKFGLLVCDEAQELTMLATSSDNEILSVYDRAMALYKVISLIPQTTKMVMLSGTTNKDTATDLCNYLNRCKGRNFDVPFVTEDRNASNITVSGDLSLRDESAFLRTLKNQILTNEGTLVIIFSKKRILETALKLGRLLGKREFSQVKINIDGNIIFNDIFISSSNKKFGKSNENFGHRISSNMISADKDVLNISDPFLRNCALAGFGYIYSVKDDETGTREKSLQLQNDFNIISGLFEAKKIKLLLSTSAVGVGVNMKVQQMYIPSISFARKTLSIGTLSQLLNRVGRGDYPITNIYTVPENVNSIKAALTAKNTDFDKGYIIRPKLDLLKCGIEALKNALFNRSSSFYEF